MILVKPSARFKDLSANLRRSSGLTHLHVRHTPSQFWHLQTLCRTRQLCSGHKIVPANCGTRGKHSLAIAAGNSLGMVTDDSAAKAFKKLQNGSDIRGIAITVPDEAVTLSPAHALFIARGFVDFLIEHTGKAAADMKVSVGSDPRLSGPAMASALSVGFAMKGVHITDFGAATTPAMFMSCVLPGYDWDGAIMITASHLPFHRNGFKFFTAKGSAEKADISNILASAARQAVEEGIGFNGSPKDAQKAAAYTLTTALATDSSFRHEEAFMPVYAEHLRNIIKDGVGGDSEKPLEGFKIVVDAGNGGGGYFATDVLEPLGADISGSQFLDGDGTFPNHIPNPENKAAMEAGCAMVTNSKADMGIVFDTDVDRSAVVASDGTPINSNRYIALMAFIALREHPGTTVVTDSVTSNALTDFINGLGGKHFRYMRGYKNVINKGIELGKQGVDCQLMMETSGHGAMQQNYYLDDGAYSAVRCVIEMVRQAGEGNGRDISSAILADLKEPLESREFRLKVTGEGDLFEGMAGVLECFHDWLEAGAGGAPNWTLEKENYEGWRVSVDEGEGRRGWLLLRASLHDPLMVLNIESEVRGGSTRIALQLMNFFMISCATDVDVNYGDLAMSAGFDRD